MDPQQLSPAALPASGASMAPSPSPSLPVGGEPASSSSGLPSSGPGPGITPPAGGDAAPGGTSAPAFTSVRDAVRDAYGVDLSHLPDDRSALQYLVSEAVQGRQYADAASKYLQNASEFEQWQAQRAAQQQQQQQPKPGWWNPPEWKQEWNSLVRLDPATGRPAAGTPPDIASKYLAYQQYRQQWADRLLDDPAGALKPLISEQAQEIAKQMVQEHLGGYQEKVWADQFVSQNSSWLHQRDANNNVLMVADPRTGLATPKLSPLGTRFREYVVQAHRSGVGNLEAQQQYARGMLERDLLSAQYQMSRANQQGQAQKDQLLAQQTMRQPDFAGTLPPVTPNPSGQMPQNPTLSLRDMLTAEFKRHGLTDADFAQPRV